MPILNNKELDKTSVIKTKLKHIIRPDKYDYVISKLTDVGIRVNNLIIRNYQFMRSYILYCFEQKIKIPIINKDFIRMSFKILTEDKTVGPSIKGDNLELLTRLTNFYKPFVNSFNFGDKISGKNLSQIIEYATTSIKTSINNNITLHFCDYIKKDVNIFFDIRINTEKEKYNKQLLTGKQLNDRIKILHKERDTMKNDLINGSNNSDSKYKMYINYIRDNYLPRNIKVSLLYDLNSDPQKYIPHMIQMNRNFERYGAKQLQFFPLRTDYVIKYFPLDTKSIIEILIESDKNRYLKNLTDNQTNIWEEFFNVKKSIFKKKKYEFSYIIYTNCYSVSILFEHESEISKTKAKKVNKIKGLKLSKLNEKGLSETDKDEQRRLKKAQPTYNLKLKSMQTKEEYKKLPKEEKIKKRIENKNLAETKAKIEMDEYMKLSSKEKKIHDMEKDILRRKNQPIFPYIEELTELQIEELKNTNKVYIDPGKIRLLTMLGDNDKIMTYSNRQRIRETKRQIYKKKIEKYKLKDLDGENIKSLEVTLSDYNSKSCVLNTFLKYVFIKNELNKKLLPKYQAPIFRQLKWYAYINKQRSEQRLIGNIKKTFGTNVVLMMGDWSISKQMRGIISTPLIGLKKMLRRNFDVINIDEYNTSKLNHITEDENENLYLLMKKLTKEDNKEKIKKKKDRRNLKSNKTKKKKKGKNADYKHNKKRKKESLTILNMDSPILIAPGNNLSTDEVSMGRYKLHSVLTYKMENKRLGCINRDRNAIFNIKKIVTKWLDDRSRPHNFVRKKICAKLQTISKSKIYGNHS
jgi:hypothetical protein